MMDPDFYAILGVTPQADAAQIKTAFRHLARALHPDSATAPAAPERLAQVLAAWHVLADPAKRASYDRARSAPTTGRARQQMPEGTSGEPHPNDATLLDGPTVIHIRTAPPSGAHIRVGPPIRMPD
ncbi:hypothetical protein GCM10009839_59220 [Catenulispora yoronensis]|uniref:J domain-containing protein n=2 Tax=Catenulispora yoronensis TaxID=450799 RepID=A0ABN2V0H0_9ACTN